MNAYRAALYSSVLGLCLLYLPTDSSAASRGAKPNAPQARLQTQISLEKPMALSQFRSGLLAEETLFCFDSLLTAVINPGCFAVSGSSGDCSSKSTHYMIQLLDPADALGLFNDTWRVKEVAFITNDGDTVWPSVGIVRIPVTENRFPTSQELQNLQVQNIASPGDTSEVVVDLRSANVEFTYDHLLYMVVQFPEGGTLTAPLVGPGLLADEQGSDPLCSFFTQDTGATWYAPLATDPLDWGFAVVVEQVVAIEERAWSNVKLLYRLPGNTPASGQ